MDESEVILVDSIPDRSYEDLIQECVKYAIISLPFTVDRMKIPNPVRRALNIAKGKIAENLFKFFCVHNNIPADFDTPSTPFYTIDNRDFILDEFEWDIKNNFIYSTDRLLNVNYTDLPALIPNRFHGDQWSKRDNKLFNDSKGTKYLFSFLKGADLIDNKRGQEFLEINLNKSQIKFINELYSKYKGLPQTSQPFTESQFWDRLESYGNSNYYVLHFKPALVICGYADNNYWDQFKDTGKFDRQNNFHSYLSPRWYEKTWRGSCNFLNGSLWTTITNATLPLSRLPSFLSLYPNISGNLKYATLR